MIPSFRQIAILVCVSVIPFPFVSLATAQTDDRRMSRKELDAAWAERAERLNSVTMTTAIEEFTNGRGAKPYDSNDPFRDPRPKSDHVSKVRTEFAFENGKIAFVRTTDDHIDADDPEKSYTQTIRKAFDGKTSASLLNGKRPSFAAVQIAPTPHRDLFVGADFLAVGLWLYPQTVLRHIGWSVGDMRLDSRAVVVDGIPCRRVRIPRKGRRWTSTMDVDPEHGWAPVSWTTTLNDKLAMKLTIDYKTHDKWGPVPTAWRLVSNNSAGETDNMRTGRVTQYEINQEVSDDLFTIEFPDGIEVTDLLVEGNPKQFQQMKCPRPAQEDERKHLR